MGNVVTKDMQPVWCTTANHREGLGHKEQNHIRQEEKRAGEKQVTCTYIVSVEWNTLRVLAGVCSVTYRPVVACIEAYYTTLTSMYGVYGLLTPYNECCKACTVMQGHSCTVYFILYAPCKHAMPTQHQLQWKVSNRNKCCTWYLRYTITYTMIPPASLISRQ